VVVDVFQVLIKNKREMDSKEIENLVISNRKVHNLAVWGVASSNIRRQLLRLRTYFL